MAWHSITYDRNQLYAEVWAEPMQTVAERYGVSDVALAKTCRKLNIPLPGRGHWAKIAAGQKIERTPLQPLKAGQTGKLYSQFRRRTDKFDKYGEDARSLIERENDPEFAVTVADTLTSPHRLIRQSAKILRMKKEATREQRLAEKPCLDILATGDALERALWIADAIIKGAERRGFQVEISESVRLRVRDDSNLLKIVTRPGRSTIDILGSQIGFSIVEGSDRIELEPDPRHLKTYGTEAWDFRYAATHKRVPNGRLSLKLESFYTYDGRHNWTDGKKQRVEDCLQKFFIAAIHIAESQRLKREEDAARRKAEYEAQLRREEEERRAELQAQLVYDLRSRIDDVQSAEQVREFVERVISSPLNSEKDFSDESQLGQWVAWAKRYADKLEKDALGNVLSLREKPVEKKRGYYW